MSLRAIHEEDRRADFFDKLEIPGQQGRDENGEVQIYSDREWCEEVDQRDYSGHQ